MQTIEVHVPFEDPVEGQIGHVPSEGESRDDKTDMSLPSGRSRDDKNGHVPLESLVEGQKICPCPSFANQRTMSPGTYKIFQGTYPCPSQGKRDIQRDIPNDYNNGMFCITPSPSTLTSSIFIINFPYLIVFNYSSAILPTLEFPAIPI